MSQLYSTTITSERKRYQHLKFEDRVSIKIYHKLGYSLRETASALNCAASTVLNELKRGTGTRKGNRGRLPEYSAKRGQANYEANRLRCHRKTKITSDSAFIQWVTKKVKDCKWSLDACVGYSRKNKLFQEQDIVSTRSLYNALWSGRLPITVFDVPEVLSRKTGQQRHHKNKRILGTSIDERPAAASDRSEYGHWEIDTVVGKKAGRESVVLTLVEKKSDFYIAIKIPGKDAKSVNAAMAVIREEYGKQYFSIVFKTITADNGSEFDSLQDIESWGVKVYFAHPYSSWERPQNERHNRLFRRYIPKGVSIENYSAEQILSFADEMNDLPRKQLKYFTPAELFDSFLDQVYSLEPTLNYQSVQVVIAI